MDSSFGKEGILSRLRLLDEDLDFRFGGARRFCPATFFCATAYGRIYVWIILSQCFCFFAYSSLSDTGKPVCRH